MPGLLRIAEVHFDVGGQREALMFSHLFATIPGQRFVEFPRQLVSLLNECVDHRLGIFARHPVQHDKPRVTLDKRRDLAVVAATE